ncbi:hypothetical protein PR048_002998, partial [Dryococelus australis]
MTGAVQAGITAAMTDLAQALVVASEKCPMRGYNRAEAITYNIVVPSEDAEKAVEEVKLPFIPQSLAAYTSGMASLTNQRLETYSPAGRSFNGEHFAKCSSQPVTRPVPRVSGQPIRRLEFPSRMRGPDQWSGQHSASVCIECERLSADFLHIIIIGYSRGRGGVVVRLLASHLGEQGSITSGVVPGFLCVVIVLDGSAGRRFSWGSPVFPVLAFRRCSILTSIALIGSQDHAPMSVIEVSIEQRRNEGPGEAGDPREDPQTNGIVRHDSHMRESGVTRPGIEPGSPWWEVSRVTAQPPWPLCSGAGMIGGGKRKIPEKIRRPTASSGTIPTSENPVTRPGIEPGSPWRETSVLIAQPPWPPMASGNLPYGRYTRSNVAFNTGRSFTFLSPHPPPPHHNKVFLISWMMARTKFKNSARTLTHWRIAWTHAVAHSTQAGPGDIQNVHKSDETEVRASSRSCSHVTMISRSHLVILVAWELDELHVSRAHRCVEHALYESVMNRMISGIYSTGNSSVFGETEPLCCNILLILAVNLLASHQREPRSIPGRVTPGFSHVVIVPDDAFGRRVFSGISRSPALLFRRYSILTPVTLIGSQMFVVQTTPEGSSVETGDPEKTCLPVASSCTIPTCENPGVTRPRIEPGSHWGEASRLTAQPPRPPKCTVSGTA